MRSRSTRIDRYPAKMVSRLASALIERFASDAERLADPFCGSGAILTAGKSAGVASIGGDINPYAVLLSNVKLAGFDTKEAAVLCSDLCERAITERRVLPIEWSGKSYWFDSDCLETYERLRYHALELELNETREGRAVLLALALSVRICSKADQRSPKPFISKMARARHARPEPLAEIETLLRELSGLYGTISGDRCCALLADVVNGEALVKLFGRVSHVITSPPYLNAQDYFRNSKLELYMLQGIVPFDLALLRGRFIGTDRALSYTLLSDVGADRRRKLIPQLVKLEAKAPKLGRVVHRYFHDMQRVCERIRDCLSPGGTLVMVAGNNLVGGLRIQTWEILNTMIEEMGFELFDRYGDPISCRSVPPTRLGHKGLIKEEMISAFHRH